QLSLGTDPAIIAPVAGRADQRICALMAIAGAEMHIAAAGGACKKRKLKAIGTGGPPGLAISLVHRFEAVGDILDLEPQGQKGQVGNACQRGEIASKTLCLITGEADTRIGENRADANNAFERIAQCAGDQRQDGSFSLARTGVGRDSEARTPVSTPSLKA